MTQSKKQHHDVGDRSDFEITSWGGAWIRLRDMTDGESIVLSIDEVDSVIAALQAAKEAQQKPDIERQEKARLHEWNKQAALTYKPKAKQ